MKKHIEGMTMEEYSKKQKREHLLTRLRKYYQSHLWCAFGTEILLALGAAGFGQQKYPDADGGFCKYRFRHRSG